MTPKNLLENIVTKPQDFGDNIMLTKLATGGVLINRIDGAGDADPAASIMLDNHQVHVLVDTLKDVPPVPRTPWPKPANRDGKVLTVEQAKPEGAALGGMLTLLVFVCGVLVGRAFF